MLLRAARPFGFRFLAAVLLCQSLGPACAASGERPVLLNAGADPSREMFKEMNGRFAEWWAAQGGGPLLIRTSPGGSRAQARSVLDGLPPDVVTPGPASDIDMLADAGLMRPDWADRLPNRAVPYATIVFPIRATNPKRILDWPDLVRDDTSVITANPRTSSGGWSYLVALCWRLHQPGGAEAAAEAFLRALCRHVPMLDSGMRGGANSFLTRGEGDVLLSCEDDALLVAHDLGPQLMVLVYRPAPSWPNRRWRWWTAWRAHGTEAASLANLPSMFVAEGQEILVGAR